MPRPDTSRDLDNSPEAGNRSPLVAFAPPQDVETVLRNGKAGTDFVVIDVRGAVTQLRASDRQTTTMREWSLQWYIDSAEAATSRARSMSRL